ncbi:MAG: choice-of-anchor D domain-containing protein [Acidobacteriota bacterium]
MRRRTITRRPGSPPRSAPTPQAPNLTFDADGAEDPTAKALLDLPLGDAPPGEASSIDVRRLGAPEPRGPEPGAVSSSTTPQPGSPPGPGHRLGHSPPPGRRTRPDRPWLWLLLLLVPLAGALGWWLRPAPAVARLDADLVDFGTVGLGEGSDRSVTVENVGQAALHVTGFTLSGDHADDFAGSAAGCLGRDVAEGAGCVVEIRFEPRGDGPRRAFLEVENDGLGGGGRIPLLGVGASPRLSLPAERIDFGEHTVGYRGGDREVRIGNSGSAPLTVESLRLEGLAAADFVRFADRCSRTVLDPGESCTVRFELVPTAPGERLARLAVESDAFAESGANSAVVELVGRGLPQAPLLTLQPDRVEFAPQRVGTLSEPLEISVGNAGNGPLRLTGVQLLTLRDIGAGEPGGNGLGDAGVDGAATSHFQLGADDCAREALGPGEDCRLRLVFAPQGEGPLSALVEIRHGDGGSHRTPVVGLGTAPKLSLGVETVTFGEAPVGRQGDWRGVELGNPGSAPLRIRSVSLAGADRSAFGLAAEGCVSVPVEPSRSCRVEVRFQARRSGPHRAELVIQHDAGPDRLLPLNGLGVSARLEVNAERLDFGTLRAGSRKELEIGVRNAGRAALTLLSAEVVGAFAGDFTVVRDCAGQVLRPGTSCALGVRFAPGSQGARRARLKIRSDGQPKTIEVALAGLAVPAPAPALRLTPEGPVTFPPSPLGQRGPIEVLEVSNTGTGPLVLHRVTLEGPAASDFKIVPGSCAVGSFVRPGASCTYGVSATPSAPGERRGELRIHHNAGDGGDDGVTVLRLVARGTSTGGSPPGSVP